ncbi:MAG: MBL fold metallo-hydrolase [Alphaproteobacteria bacterium]|jgi:glyoxylase-like metal-dependent hydrolase (beta-lactamase superfamily II)|nr:MBL fold metallo-hydrolase [Alphaproteobacteria bacterium]
MSQQSTKLETLSRRSVLRTGTGLAAGLGGLAAAGGTVTLGPRLAHSAAPMADSQVPGLYRTKVGGVVVTAIADGFLNIPLDYFTGTTPEEMGPVLHDRFMPPEGPIPTAINAFLVNTGDRLIAIDSGAADRFGPSAGRYAALLETAGLTPGDVDMVLLTHAHPDHIGGMVAGGAALFPNSEVLIHQAELDFWTSDARRAAAPEGMQPMFDLVVAMRDLYGDRISPFSGNAAVAPGVTAVAAHGHTPGHCGFMVESEGEQLFIWGDLIHSVDTQLQHPDWLLVFDIDQENAEASRRRGLDMAATDRLQVAGAHLPFPSFGHIGREGSGYRFVPSPWEYEL